MSDEVLVSVADGILEVTINRPDAKNAMNRAAAEGISQAMDRLEAEDDLRCAILTGAGGTFCSGMDLKGFLTGDLPIVADRGFGALTSWTPKKPVIAAVDGFAFAGGLELALACDMIVANVEAKFALPEVKRGLLAAGGGVILLPRLLPRALAMELALTIAGNGPLAVMASKAIIRDSWLWSEEEAQAKQSGYIGHVFTSEDAREGAKAFAEKRKPEWKGK
jgi:enoyl-CoA hydratase